MLDVLRWGLAIGILLANVAVWRGVYLEDDRFHDSIKKQGWRLLLRGLAAEAALGFLLFSVDMSASLAEYKEIAKLRTRAAEAELKLERLKGPRNISEADHMEIIRRLKPFGLQNFSVGFPITGIEPGSHLKQDLLKTLQKDLGWTLVSAISSAGRAQPAPNNGVFGTVGVLGVLIFYDRSHPDLKLPAETLSNLLDKLGIASRAEATSDGTPGAITVDIGAKT